MVQGTQRTGRITHTLEQTLIRKWGFPGWDDSDFVHVCREGHDKHASLLGPFQLAEGNQEHQPRVLLTQDDGRIGHVVYQPVRETVHSQRLQVFLVERLLRLVVVLINGLITFPLKQHLVCLIANSILGPLLICVCLERIVLPLLVLLQVHIKVLDHILTADIVEERTEARLYPAILPLQIVETAFITVREGDGVNDVILAVASIVRRENLFLRVHHILGNSEI